MRFRFLGFPAAVSDLVGYLFSGDMVTPLSMLASRPPGQGEAVPAHGVG